MSYMKVKSFMLSHDFARSLKKDRLNPCSINIPTNDAGNDEDVAVGGDEIEQREIPSILNEDISSFRAQGFSVDNDNEPAPEYFPTPANTVNDGMYRAGGVNPWTQKGGWCQRCAAYISNKHNTFGFLDMG